MTNQVQDKRQAILLVEDDDADSEIIELLLKRSNISNPFYRARDGFEALEMLKKMMEDENLNQPFLLLLDIYMPRMNGLELLEKIRLEDSLRDNTIFMLTTSSWVQDKARAYNLNVAGYIHKDRMHDLAAFVNRHCAIKAPPVNATDIFNRSACAARA